MSSDRLPTSAAAPPSPRLTLHIPNSHPRVTSPRGSPRQGNSPLLSPAPSADGVPPPPPPPPQQQQHTHDGAHDGPPTHPRPEMAYMNRASIEQSYHAVTAFFHAHDTTGESARDFLARERTFFSWLRLANMLAIASAALFLRLQIKSNLSDVFNPTPRKRRVVDAQKGAYTQQWEQALRRRAKRLQKRRHERQLPLLSPPIGGLALSGQLAMTHNSLSETPSQSMLTGNSSTHHNSVLDTHVLLSKGLGGAFFILALVALGVGYVDYMICVRALEHADEVVPPPGVRQAVDAANSTAAERSTPRQKLHIMRYALRAHSSRVVFITEITIAMIIFATALIILISAGSASVAPVSSAAFVLRPSRLI